MFQNAPPPAPTIFSKKVFPPRGGGIVKHIRREPVSEFPPTKKCSTHGGWIMKQVPSHIVHYAPQKKTGGGILKQVAWRPVS